MATSTGASAPQRLTRGARITIAVSILLLLVPLVLSLPAFRSLRPDYRVFTAFNSAILAGQDGNAYVLLSDESQARLSYVEFHGAWESRRDRVGSLRSVRVDSMHSHGSRNSRTTTIEATLIGDRGTMRLEYLLWGHYSAWRVWSCMEK